MQRSAEVLSKCERSFVSLTEFEKFKIPNQPILINHFAFDIVKNLPSQVEKFFELQRFDLDITLNMLESPRHTVISLSDSDNQSPSTTSHTLFMIDEETETRGSPTLMSLHLDELR